MNTYYRISDGQAVEETEALIGKALKDGYGVRTSVTFMDGGTTIPVGYVLDGSMLISDAQDGYEARISDAWRGGDRKPAKLPRVAPTPYKFADKFAALPASQAAFEKRLSDAWKGAAR